MEPSNVTKDNEKQLWWQMYMIKTPPLKKEEIIKFRKRKPSERINFKFKTGDSVRIPYIRSPFEREYGLKWTAEIFSISKRAYVDGFCIYKIVDLNNELVQGLFYESELQRVEILPDEIYKIEKVLKKKKVNSKVYYFVKWEGWPKSFNQRIPEENITNLK